MDGITVDRAKSGHISAHIGKKRIHSSYHPEKEATRFVKDPIATLKNNALVVIIGAGLGYIGRELKNTRPDLTIISCYLSTHLYIHRIDKRLDALSWYPGMVQSPEEFFYQVIEEQQLPGLRILEWPASLDAAPEYSSSLHKALLSVIRRYSGNIFTTAAFGRLWIRNTIRNFRYLNTVVQPSEGSGAIVLAVAGPSLENQMPLIERYRSNFELWALPSSLRSLCRWGIKPDLVFSTDPGYWARLHMRWFPDNVPVAMPLTAAVRPRPYAPTFLLSQQVIGEEELFGSDAWQQINIKQAGSVAISAIETWQKIGQGPLILIGMDLCWFDLRSHVRPHSFDEYLSQSDKRTRPALTTQWLRAKNSAPKRFGQYRSSPALKTYADWFGSAEFSNTVYRINSGGINPTNLDGVTDTDSSIFRDLPRREKRFFKVMKAPVDHKERQNRIAKLIESWKKLADTGIPRNAREKELMYLIDPGGVLDVLRGDGEKGLSAREEHRIRFGQSLNELLHHT